MPVQCQWQLKEWEVHVLPFLTSGGLLNTFVGAWVLGIVGNVGKGVPIRYVGIPFCLLRGFPYPRISNTSDGTGPHTRLQRPREVKPGHIRG